MPIRLKEFIELLDENQDIVFVGHSTKRIYGSEDIADNCLRRFVTGVQTKNIGSEGLMVVEFEELLD